MLDGRISTELDIYAKAYYLKCPARVTCYGVWQLREREKCPRVSDHNEFPVQIRTSPVATTDLGAEEHGGSSSSSNECADSAEATIFRGQNGSFSISKYEMKMH